MISVFRKWWTPIRARGSLAMLILGCLFLSCAFAADAPAAATDTQSGPVTIMPFIATGVQWLLGICGAAITTVAVWALTKLASHFGIQMAGTEHLLIEGAAKIGFNKAEAWAANLSNKPTGSEKMDQALQTTKAILASSIGKHISDDIIKHYIESHVAQFNADAPVVATTQLVPAAMKN